MNMTLHNKSKDLKILSNMKEARTLWPRLKGLLGTKEIAEDSGLWIHSCNSIHTFGMRYSIDCIFIDSKFCVRKLIKDVKPGYLIWPIWSARSVIEVKAGTCEKFNIQVGDLLHVDN
jgi:uncharacterized membrane protein (UPF0127 family)